MYVPAAFTQTDLDSLHRFIEQHSFGILTGQYAGEPFASHLPFLLDRTAGANGTLIGHLARANPQWKEAATQSFLAIFPGPHAYISPAWYEAQQVVPTWNYIAVHATGRLSVIEDPDQLWEIVTRSVQVYEQNRPIPWEIGDRTAFMEKLLGQIVGFRLVIERLEGKFKLSQNQPEERRRKVIQALSQQPSDNAQMLVKYMNSGN